jgi:hypothetical protein
LVTGEPEMRDKVVNRLKVLRDSLDYTMDLVQQYGDALGELPEDEFTDSKRKHLMVLELTIEDLKYNLDLRRELV